MKILLIEDDADDILLLKHALDENRINYTLDEVMEGDKITAYMQHCIVLPDVIVMDLNLPKKHGREILVNIKENEKFKNIAIIILTTSTNEAEKKANVKQRCKLFFNKTSYKSRV